MTINNAEQTWVECEGDPLAELASLSDGPRLSLVPPPGDQSGRSTGALKAEPETDPGAVSVTVSATAPTTAWASDVEESCSDREHGFAGDEFADKPLPVVEQYEENSGIIAAAAHSAPAYSTSAYSAPVASTPVAQSAQVYSLFPRAPEAAPKAVADLARRAQPQTAGGLMFVCALAALGLCGALHLRQAYEFGVARRAIAAEATAPEPTPPPKAVAAAANQAQPAEATGAEQEAFRELPQPEEDAHKPRFAWHAAATAEAGSANAQPASLIGPPQPSWIVEGGVAYFEASYMPPAVDRIPMGRLRLRSLHTEESIAVQPFGASGRVDDDAFAEINHLLRCRITGEEKAMDPNLIRIITMVGMIYGKEIDVVSGFRPPYTLNTSPTSQHTFGRAVDIRIAGVSVDELASVVRDLGARGIGVYRHKKFVHVDVRREHKYFWEYHVDHEGDEEPEPYRPRRRYDTTIRPFRRAKATSDDKEAAMATLGAELSVSADARPFRREL